MPATGARGIIFDIKRYAIHDGPGIRTTVFLKGCPLRCPWCQNPESQTLEPQLSIWDGRCITCGACVDICPRRGISHGNNGHVTTDRTRCIRCGSCAHACPADARSMLGREWTVEQLIDEVAKDHLFFDESGGGVTFSGGEPLVQADFLIACLQACQRAGYHTTVDTCGYAPTQALQTVAEYTDLFLFDLKLMESDRHRQQAGLSNDPILNNLRYLCKRGSTVWIRFPLIPGINDDEANLTALTDFIQSLDQPVPLQLLPYHRIAGDKYDRLDMTNPMNGVEPPTAERIAEVADRFTNAGVDVKIGG